jgi:hypothetical protein
MHEGGVTQNSAQLRHPELVSGSIVPMPPKVCREKWMLKQVQHDEGGERMALTKGVAHHA